jgi:hypothetical protein
MVMTIKCKINKENSKIELKVSAKVEKKNTSTFYVWISTSAFKVGYFIKKIVVTLSLKRVEKNSLLVVFWIAYNFKKKFVQIL